MYPMKEARRSGTSKSSVLIDRIRERLTAEGLSARAAALNAGLPVRSVQGVLEGHSPSLERAQEICEALGLELYIGPPRSSPDLNSEARRSDGDPEVKAAESSVFYGAALPPAQLSDIALAAQALARAVSKNGGDPIPKEMRQEMLQALEQEMEDLRHQASEAGAYAYVPRYEIWLAAGSGGIVHYEAPAGHVAFRRDWLDGKGLNEDHLSLVHIRGDSMAPAILDGDSALVDHSRREPRSGVVFALRTEDGLLVKRLMLHADGWWAESDNKDADDSDSRPLGDTDDVIGQIVWWARTVDV